MILHRNQKGFRPSPVYKHLKCIFAYTKNKKYTWVRETGNAWVVFFKTNLHEEWMTKFVALIAKEKRKMDTNELENDNSDILSALYSVCNKIRTIVFPYLTSVLLKVINIWTNS